MLRADRSFIPAVAGQGYVELARQRPDEALAAFDRATADQTGYTPALVGRGLALLASGREDLALASFEAALAADPSLPDLASRVEVLRVRQAQDRVTRAEQAAAAGRFDEARDAYLAAIAASPESPFLPRDLARSERRAGRLDAALEYAQRAVALDPSDPRSHLVEAEIREERGDVAGALAAYERAAALDPTPAVTTTIAGLRERLRDAALPPQYRQIPASPAATRADLAALLGVRLAGVLAAAPQRQLVVTDVRSHWARPWIEATARAGAMEVFSNYTFQPGDAVAPGRRGRRRAPGAVADARRWDRAVGSGAARGRRRAAGPPGVPGRPPGGERRRDGPRRRHVPAAAAGHGSRPDRHRRAPGGPGRGPVSGEPVLTVANQLTLLRLLLIPAFVLCVVYGRFGWALSIFVVAGATDALDGLIARRANQRTSLGAWLDPAADKLLLVTTFVVLTLPNLGLPNRLPLWLTILVISRDIAIVLTVAIVNLATGPRTFRPSPLGKAATGLFIVTCVVVLFFNYLGQPSPVVDWFVWASLAITLASSVDYVRRLTSAG